MKKRMGKMFLFCLALLMILLTFTGCKASKKKVLESEYYKELQVKYKKLKKENKELKKETDNQEQVNDDANRAEKFLAKIARDKLTRVEVAYPDKLEDAYYIEETEVYGEATLLAQNADRTNKYTPEQLEKSGKEKYKYVLYDENNAIYDLLVYENDYVVFADLPKYVYYVPNASVLGDAFLESRVTSPSGGLLHNLSECPLLIDDNRIYYDNSIANAIANCIDQMKKEKSSREKAESAWEKIAEKKKIDTYEPETVTYTFYTHGKQMIVTLYDHYISIFNLDENRTWYKVSKEDIATVKDILLADQMERNVVVSDKKEDENSENNSHSKEIEEESTVNSDN